MPAPALTWAASALLAATLSLPAFALTPGLPDTFEAGSEDGWASGAGNPSPPVAVPGGGPAGANDGYLLLSASGSPGAGGRLVAFGGPQWAGDYTQAGVTGITLDVKNLGATDLSLRLLFSSALGNAYSLTPVLVLAGSDWQPVRFDTRPAALAGVGAASLPAVTGLRLYHSPTLGEPTAAPFVAARLGLDNVTAVPEPITGHLLLAGLALLAAVRRAGVRLTKLRPAGHGAATTINR